MLLIAIGRQPTPQPGRRPAAHDPRPRSKRDSAPMKALQFEHRWQVGLAFSALQCGQYCTAIQGTCKTTLLSSRLSNLCKYLIGVCAWGEPNPHHAQAKPTTPSQTSQANPSPPEPSYFFQHIAKHMNFEARLQPPGPPQIRMAAVALRSLDWLRPEKRAVMRLVMF